MLLPAAAQARERRARGGCSIVVEVLATPFVWIGGLIRPAPAYYAPTYYAPTYYAPSRPAYGRVSDTDYMLYGSGRSCPRYR